MTRSADTCACRGAGGAALAGHGVKVVQVDHAQRSKRVLAEAAVLASVEQVLPTFVRCSAPAQRGRLQVNVLSWAGWPAAVCGWRRLRSFAAQAPSYVPGSSLCIAVFLGGHSMLSVHLQALVEPCVGGADCW